MFRWRVCYIHGQEERRIIDLSNYDKVRLALKQEEILKPIAKENLSKAGKGLPILAKVDTRTDLSKDLPKFNARDDKVYQDIRREEKKEKIKLNPVKIPKGKIRDIESEWRKNEI